MFTIYLCNDCNIIGLTPEHSKRNMYNWLEMTVLRFSGPGTQVVVKDLNGHHEPGLFHHLQSHELHQIEAYLSSLSVWQTNLIAHKISFGKYFVIVSSEGGLCLIIHKIIGPFQG